MATKSKLQSLSTRRFSPRTRSGAAPEPTFTPATCVPNPKSTPGTDKIPRTPFSVNAITPIGVTLKSVSLSNWWLINGKGLGVAGFESKGGSEVRLFSSAPISTRHDSTTLETSDGLTVSISGFINRSRSLQNGFSSEVCNRFLIGFPYHWKDYTEEEFVEEEEKDYGVSFDDIPVNRLQDVLFTASPRFQNKILGDAVAGLRDLLRSSAKKPDKECQKSDKECQKPIMDEESLVPSVERVETRGMLRRREEDVTEKPDKESERSDKDCQKPIMDEESLVPSVERVETRGMLRRREEGSTEKPEKESERSDKECQKPRMDEESLVLSVERVETRGMLRKREASIGERLHRSSKKKRE